MQSAARPDDAPVAASLGAAGGLVWDAPALQRQLQPLLPGLQVQVLAEVGSTNTTLMALARDALARGEAPQPLLLVAETQTQGRGRAGRGWQAQAGASLTFSLSLPLAPADWSGLSLAVGLALAEALDPLATPEALPAVAVKWPNDLLLLDSAPGEPRRGRKLAGILIETVGSASEPGDGLAGAARVPRTAVVGVGINVQPLAVAQASQGVAGAQELWPGISAPATLARVAQPLLQALLDFQAAGLAPGLARYARRDLLAGQPVVAGGGTPQALEGVAEGVDAQGHLRLRVGGRVQLVQAGDVSVRALNRPVAEGR